MATTDRLLTKRSLHYGERLTSTDDRFILVHQQDGNVVLYEKETGKPLWASGTYGKNTVELVMQEDGNLVLYASGGNPVWAADTYGAQNAIAVMQNDGNFVVKDGSGSIVWSTKTAQDKKPRTNIPRDQIMRPGDEIVSKSGKNKLVFRPDGNVVLLKHGREVWDTKTSGSRADTLVLQLDGNLVLYDDERPLWASGTQGKYALQAVVQDDGNFVIYGYGGHPHWATGTHG